MNLLRPVHRLRRRVLRHRRPLAVLSVAGAAWLGLQSFSPPPPATVAVLTASHDLPGGTVLRPDDLALTRFALDTAPRGAVSRARSVVGRTLAAPMARGEAVTTLRTVSQGLLAGYPGRTAVPVRVTDAAMVALLRVGDRVTLVAADPDGRRPPSTLASDVPVLAVPRVRQDALAGGTPGRLVVVAVASALAADLAADAATSLLVVTWGR